MAVALLAVEGLVVEKRFETSMFVLVYYYACSMDVYVDFYVWLMTS